MATNIYDTGDYMELLLKHLIRDPGTLAKAMDLGLVGKDFMASEDEGVMIYKVCADIALEIGVAPIDSNAFLLHLKHKLASNVLFSNQTDQVLELVNSFYASPLAPEYYIHTLKAFIKHRRQEQAKYEFDGNNDKISKKFSEIAVEFDDVNEDVIHKVEAASPFEVLVKKESTSLVGTGFKQLDDILCGLGRGEYGLIIGYSGGGKTAFGTNLCGNAANYGLNATYLSLEESLPDIANRFYSRYYGISYSALHNGNAGMQLEQSFRDKKSEGQMQRLAKNLMIEPLKEFSPLTAEDIKNILQRNFDNKGFIPDVVVLDQLQFIAPCKSSDLKSWEVERIAAKELDNLSHMKIGGKHFALWVLHQAKGKNKIHFTTEEIDGFKGIIHSADTVLGIGREGPTSTDFSIFSLKSRHSKNFVVTLQGNLEFMTFVNPHDSLAIGEYKMPDSNPIKQTSLL